MKALMFLPLFLLTAVHGMAQTEAPRVSISARYGTTPYERASGLGMGIQYLHPVGKMLAFSGSAGWMQGNYVTTTPIFAFTNREFVVNADASALINLVPGSRYHDLYLGGGLSLMHTIFNYARDIHSVGVIMERHTSTLPMLHLVLEDHYALTDHWALFGRAIVRSTIQERDVVRRSILESGSAWTSGGFVTSMLLSWVSRTHSEPMIRSVL